MQIIALLFIGFSLGITLLLILSNLLSPQANKPCVSKVAGFLLISGLAGIQTLHLGMLVQQFDLLHSVLYLIFLYSIAPCFYFYSRQLLIADSRYQWRDVFHLSPFIPCFALPYPLAFPCAFLTGCGYLLWLAKAVYFLRAQRLRFRLELFALGSFFVIAIAALVLGFIWPLLNERDFILSYSLLIGLAFFLAILTLLQFPTLSADISEAVQAAYSESTLKNIDKALVLGKLDTLMKKDKLYTLETLNLPLLAEQLELTQHQLSELINTEFQQGFSRYIRQHRIEEAKRLLLAEPNASVLSIGLSVGFSSQSNFYSAFRDICGIAPGQYRKNQS